MVMLWYGCGWLMERAVRKCPGKAVFGEVGFEMSGKDMGNLGGKVAADTVELNQEMARNGWRCLKGGLEAITSIVDGAIQPKEGDEGGLDVMEGRWVD